MVASGPASIAYFNKLGIIGTNARPTANPPLSPNMHESFKGSILGSETIMENIVKFIKSGNLAEFRTEAQKLSLQKISLNTPTTGGWTCLHYAAYMGRNQIITILIQN